MDKKLLFVGTRPEAIKLAPLIAELKVAHGDNTVVVSTGQHGLMLREVLQVFDIEPDFGFQALKEGQTLSSLGSSLLLESAKAIAKFQPSLVIVHGDTSTALFGALAAFYASVKVGHVEAGLRSHDIFEPFPEEMNRKTIASIAQIHFSPTFEAKQNLITEGVSDESIFVTGNTVVDAVRIIRDKYLSNSDWSLSNQSEIRNKIFPQFNYSPFGIVTLHRRENAGHVMQQYLLVIKKLALEHPDFHFVFPVHPNPLVRNPALTLLAGIQNIHLVEPIDYLDFLHLLSRSSFIISDSGGIQEEAVTLGKTVFVCRNITERPEGLNSGRMKIVGRNFDHLYSQTSNMIREAVAATAPNQLDPLFLEGNPFGDGYASRKIVEVIRATSS